MDLNVTSATAFISESTGYLTIVGEVLNTTPQEKTLPRVAATVYDQQGQVIGTGNTYADIYPIPSRGRSPFQITFSEDDISNISEAKSFRIQASAN